MIKDQHIPIMANEILSFINRKKNLSILDCTFGGGGHSKKFLENGHIVTAIDQDDNSLLIAKQLKKNFPNIFFHKNNFKNLDLLDLNIKRFNFILLDLGFSSNQLDDNDIGLSFKINSKLNMNYLRGDLNAYKIINYYDMDELKRVFHVYGEINQAEKLAKYIINQRSIKKINTNFEFIEILRESGVNFRSKRIHFATQAFQALRIESNNELENLETFLKKVHNFLDINAFLAVISFHSLEDRIVKNYFRDNKVNKNNSFQNNKGWGFEILTKKPLIPSKLEVIENNRSRSAKLRVGRFIN
jgi:16S rRNA (cytosine1402-N4)-methyltransferase